MKKHIAVLVKRILVFFVTFFLLLVYTEQINRSHIILRLRINKSCDLSVFYDNGEADGYCFDDKHLAQVCTLSLGEQTVKISIPQEGMSRLRLDFGNEPCDVEVYELALAPNTIVNYVYSAEDVFYSFSTRNDISACNYKNGAARYTVSGSDGHIATLTPLPEKTATYRIDNLILQALFLLGAPLAAAFGDKVYFFGKKTYKKHSRLCNYVVPTLALEITLLLLCPQYWLLLTAFSVSFGFSLCYAFEYFAKNAAAVRDYLRISLVCLIALMPLFLTGFYYGDSYWSRYAGKTVAEHINLTMAMKRPFVGIIAALFGDISVENSYIMRICFAVALLFSALLLYQFVEQKLKSRTVAYLLSIFTCASVVAVECVAYLEIFPIILSLLFSIIAYLAWEEFDRKIKKGLTRETIWNAVIFAVSILTAFYMYQIGTPIFFVLLVISVVSEQQQDKDVLKKGIKATLSYGVVAIAYLLSTSWIQTVYHVANIQSERSNFIHSIPQAVEKITWFTGTVLPQSIHRIWASILPRSNFTANNLFYLIFYKSENLGIALVVIAAIVILVFLGSYLLRGQWQKTLGCVCGIFLSFYPFLLLPESTVLTYYMLPLIILLEIFFILGLRELFHWAKRILNGRAKTIESTVKVCVTLSVTLLVLINSATYSNYWVMYCRDSYQYIKQYILSNRTDETKRIHVYGTIAPQVGSGPYVLGAVSRIFEEIGEDPAQYSVTQSDTEYVISQLTQENVQLLGETLPESEYVRFMSYYIFSPFYDCYYVKTNSFTPEEQAFLHGCLAHSGLLPDEHDEATLIISMSGFNQTHPF